MEFDLRVTDKAITAWGGRGIMKRMLDHRGFHSALRACGLPQPGSNRGDRPEQLITPFMLSVWCGANRFEHGAVTRHDPVLSRLFGFTRMANFKAVMRRFRRFTQHTNESVMDSLYPWLFGHLALTGLTLDLDSTVMTRDGAHAGAARGDHPAKRGRASHHPLMACVADTRMIAHGWLRPGNSSSANTVQGFLANTLHRLGDKRGCLLRADRGFSDRAFRDHLDGQQRHPLIALRQHHPVPRALVHATGWWVLHDEHGTSVDGIARTRCTDQPAAWSTPRGVVGIRQNITPRAEPTGKTLNLCANDPVIGPWRFSALTTDLALPAVAGWRLDRGRADCENRIKELTYDCAADRVTMKDFWATEATLNTVRLADNLMRVMRQV